MSRSLPYQQGHGGENMVLRPRTVGAIDMGGASLQVCASSRDREGGKSLIWLGPASRYVHPQETAKGVSH